jgi:hypothetical protein
MHMFHAIMKVHATKNANALSGTKSAPNTALATRTVVNFSFRVVDVVLAIVGPNSVRATLPRGNAIRKLAKIATAVSSITHKVDPSYFSARG